MSWDLNKGSIPYIIIIINARIVETVDNTWWKGVKSAARGMEGRGKTFLNKHVCFFKITVLC